MLTCICVRNVSLLVILLFCQVYDDLFFVVE